MGRGELETLGTEHSAEGCEQKSRAAAGGVVVEVVTTRLCVDENHQVERGTPMLWKEEVIRLEIEAVGQVESGAQVEGLLYRVAGRSILVGEKPGSVTTGTDRWGDIVGAGVDVWFLSASGSKVMAESENGRRDVEV